jgi:hypothetical protein
MFNNFAPPKRALYEIMRKTFGRNGQATDDNLSRRMGCECLITKATDTHTEYVILTLFHGYISFANAPYLYVICSLPVLSHV